MLACLADLSRLGVYAGQVATVWHELDWPLPGTAVTAAAAGAIVGRRFLAGMTMATVRRIVAGRSESGSGGSPGPPFRGRA